MLGLVVSSRARRADSRSESVVEAPCIAVPPAIETLVLEGRGDDVRDVAEGDAVRDDAGGLAGGVVRVWTFGRDGSSSVVVGS